MNTWRDRYTVNITIIMQTKIHPFKYAATNTQQDRIPTFCNDEEDNDNVLSWRIRVGIFSKSLRVEKFDWRKGEGKKADGDWPSLSAC